MIRHVLFRKSWYVKVVQSTSFSDCPVLRSIAQARGLEEFVRNHPQVASVKGRLVNEGRDSDIQGCAPPVMLVGL